jgi:hypothetical protein
MAPKKSKKRRKSYVGNIVEKAAGTVIRPIVVGMADSPSAGAKELVVSTGKLIGSVIGAGRDN